MTRNRLFVCISGLILLLSLPACRENSVSDPAAVRQELRQREIVHLSQGQIAERAAEMGDTLLLKAEKEFIQALKISKGSSCITAWDSVSAGMKSRYQAEIKRLLFSAEPGKRLPNQKEKQLFEAYQYSRQHKLALNPNLQKDGEKDFLFTRALVLNDKNCLSCHQNSSAPQLKGNQGDTLGIWMLRFPRKQVIMSFVE
jgi:hypothetical protein